MNESDRVRTLRVLLPRGDRQELWADPGDPLAAQGGLG